MSSRNAQILSRSRRKEFEKSCVRGTICNAPCLCIILIFNELRQYPLSFFPHIFPTKCNFIASCWMQKVVSQSMDSNFYHFCEAIEASLNLPLTAVISSVAHPYRQRSYRLLHPSDDHNPESHTPQTSCWHSCRVRYQLMDFHWACVLHHPVFSDNQPTVLNKRF